MPVRSFMMCFPSSFFSRFSFFLSLRHPDTAYILSYSIIMLNVDQHNPKIKTRMTVDDFIRNNRGINDGTDLPESFLRGVFEDISKNELKVDEDPNSILRYLSFLPDDYYFHFDNQGPPRINPLLIPTQNPKKRRKSTKWIPRTFLRQPKPCSKTLEGNQKHKFTIIQPSELNTRSPCSR